MRKQTPHLQTDDIEMISFGDEKLRFVRLNLLKWSLPCNRSTIQYGIRAVSPGLIHYAFDVHKIKLCNRMRLQLNNRLANERTKKN